MLPCRTRQWSGSGGGSMAHGQDGGCRTEVLTTGLVRTAGQTRFNDSVQDPPFNGRSNRKASFAGKSQRTRSQNAVPSDQSLLAIS